VAQDVFETRSLEVRIHWHLNCAQFCEGKESRGMVDMVGEHPATRSPAATPLTAKPLASRFTRSFSWAYVNAQSTERQKICPALFRAHSRSNFGMLSSDEK